MKKTVSTILATIMLVVCIVGCTGKTTAGIPTVNASEENLSAYDYSSFVGSWYNQDFSERFIDELRVESIKDNRITLTIIEGAEGEAYLQGTFQL